MRKYMLVLALFLTVFASNAGLVRAQETTVSGSATFMSEPKTFDFDYRVENLRNFLEKYNSPLAAFAADFVAYADKYNLDYRLVPSISGVESTFGKQIPYNSYNAYGWVNGNYNFKSWPDSIGVVSETLRKEYIDKKAASVDKIARRYAPPSTTWGYNVKYFESKIDVLPLSFDI